jgi:hypothetical protein
MLKKYLLFILILAVFSCTKNMKEAALPDELQNQSFKLNSYTTTTFVNKRIAISCDGNYHDRDDICSVSMELGIIAKAGLQLKVTYFGYNDHYWKTSSSQQLDQTNSVLNSAKSWGGFDMTKFISVRTYHSTAVTNLKNEINKSSSTDSLIICGLGPMQVIGQAIAASDPTKRKYVKVVSHSQWNNEHAGRYGSGEGLSTPRYNLDNTNSSSSPGATFISNMGVKIVKIKDQNATVSAPYSSYSWLQTSSDSRLRAIYSECKNVAAKSIFDCSDAGVVWFVIKNDQNGSPSKLKSFFGQ